VHRFIVVSAPTETDALVEKTIAEIDSVTEDLYKFLSQELYEKELVGLQGTTDLNDTAVQGHDENHIAVARY
jgi:hypothetical protein